MSFAQKYIDIIEKYTTLFESISNLKVTQYETLDIDQKYEPKLYTAELLRAVDYSDSYSSQYNGYYYDKELGEGFYAEDLTYHSTNLDWTIDINKAFTEFVNHLWYDPENHLINKRIEAIKQGENIKLFLGSFYLAVAESVSLAAYDEYQKLKTEYPNEKFYPPIHIDTSSITFYESSKCW